MKIRKDQFDLYAECILTGQIEQHEVPKLLAENPEFSAWYKTGTAFVAPSSDRRHLRDFFMGSRT